jgi:lambda repressor-like predicted transcriptional regulator
MENLISNQLYDQTVHQGSIIENVIRKNGHSITKLAISMGVNRRSVYNWFNQPKVKPDLIYRIGLSIEHDFCKQIPGLFDCLDVTQRSKLSVFITSQQSNNQEERDIKLWRTKYETLLENYNRLRFKRNSTKTINQTLLNV